MSRMMVLMTMNNAANPTKDNIAMPSVIFDDSLSFFVMVYVLHIINFIVQNKIHKIYYTTFSCRKQGKIARFKCL